MALMAGFLKYPLGGYSLFKITKIVVLLCEASRFIVVLEVARLAVKSTNLGILFSNQQQNLTAKAETTFRSHWPG
jgi:hypothetical protein